MLFKSNYALFRRNVRHKIDVPHPTLPMILNTIPELAAEFGQPSEEFEYEDSEGRMNRGVHIRGHYFDSVVAQEQNGWTDEEREQVEASLVKLSLSCPDQVQVVEQRKAAAPWPTYDSTHHIKVVNLASELGLLAEAITYERQNKNRESVVSALEEKLNAAQVPAEEDLAVA